MVDNKKFVILKLKYDGFLKVKYKVTHHDKMRSPKKKIIYDI